MRPYFFAVPCGRGVARAVQRLLIPVAFLLALVAVAPAEPLAVRQLGYTLDLPEGWRMIDGPEGRAQSFADATETAILQVFSFPAGSFASSEEMAEVIGGKLGAKGEGAPYLYSGRDATLSEMFFAAGTIPARGYGVFVRGQSTDYALLAFAPETHYQRHHDAMLSALDSFCPEDDLRSAPGPIGQFGSRFPAERAASRALSIGGRSLTLRTSADEQAASQDLVEREARIMAAEKERFLEAWQRYFRVIYRDNYLRLTSIGEELKAALHGGTPRARAETILAWIQGFKYVRSGTLSDLTSPLACLAEASGDCDSRALLYVMLLHHLGIDSVLLVSTQYQHSAVGVGVDGSGARVTVNGRGYVFAEVTDQVALGLVAQDMADPKGWTPVVLGKAPALR